jgi:2-phosphosulfolactate phosphatase
VKVFVHSGRVGAERGAREGLVTVVVDALRASATIASFLEFGATEVMVVEQVEQALAEKQRRPEAILVGERDCLRVAGCDRGNEPLRCVCSGLPGPVVFTSSNCSRCAVAAASAPRLFLGTAVNATALARAVGQAARELETDVLLVPAGSGEDETRFNMEDHLACGALLAKLEQHCPPARVANDAARAAQALFARVGEKHLPAAFLRTDHGRRLLEVGCESDVRWAARVDIYQAVPVLTEIRQLADGGIGAIFTNQPPLAA